MMRRALPVLCVLATLVPAAPAAGGKQDGAYLHDITTRFVTPHLNWARPMAGGRLRTLFVTPRNVAAREVVEMAQRLDLEFDAVAIFHAGLLAKDSVYEGSIAGTTAHEKEAELIAKLKRPCEVIVLGNVNLNGLPAEARYRIFEHVAAGGGLVAVYPYNLGHPKATAHPEPGAEDILAMAGQAGLSASIQAVPTGKLVQTYRIGKGRMVLLDYQANHSAYWGGLSLTTAEPWAATWQARYENNMALVGRAMLWAAGRTARAVLARLPLEAGEPLEAAELAATPVSLLLRGKPGARLTVACRVRDAWNEVVYEQEQGVTLGDGDTSLRLALPLLKAGQHFLDIRMLTEGAVDNFGYVPFTVASPAGQMTVRADRETWERGEPVTGRVSVEAPLARQTLVRLALVDSPYSRVWQRRDIPLGAGRTTVPFELAMSPFPTIAGRLTAELVSGTTVIHKAEQALFFPARGLEVYPTVVWSAVRGEYLAPMYARQAVGEMGWRAGLAHASPGCARVPALFDQRYVPYMTRVMLGASKDKPGWTILDGCLWGLDKQRVKTETAALEGDQSFYNPKVRELVKESVTEQTRDLAPFGPAVYTLGDENHFSYDIGHSPSDDLAFRRFVQERYGDIATLNREWGTSYASFDEVKHYTQSEAKEAQKYAAWFDQGAFAEKQYADVHHALAAWIKDVDPHARVGAEGSVPGDLERTIDTLDFWGPYEDPIMDEVLRCIGGDRLRTSWWGGFVGMHGGRNEYPLALWGQLLKGTVNGNAMFSASVSSLGLISADFSLPAYVETLRPHLDALRHGVAQLLITTPLEHHGIGLLWSHLSKRAALLDERCFPPEDAAAAVQSFCYRHGLNFDYVPSSALPKGGLKRCRIVFLCGASVLSDAECAAIREFVGSGGIVVADLNPGLLNGYGRATTIPRLADLFPGNAFREKRKPVLRPVSFDTAVRGQPLRLSTGPVSTSRDVEPCQVREIGQGLAVLLNVNLTSACDSATDGTSGDALLLNLLALAGIKPSIKASGVNLSRLVVRVRKAGETHVLGLLADPRDVGKRIDIDLPRELCIYRAAGERVGRSATLSFVLDQPFSVFCFFGADPMPPAFALDRSVVTRGDSVELALPKQQLGGVWRLETSDPQGQIMRRRTRVLVADAAPGPESVRFALSDAPGTYTLRLTDVRTGLRQERTVDVR